MEGNPTGGMVNSNPVNLCGHLESVVDAELMLMFVMLLLLLRTTVSSSQLPRVRSIYIYIYGII